MKRPLNLALVLDDGRKLIIRAGKEKSMVCRQKGAGPALVVGDRVRTIPGKDGRKAALEVVKRTRKDVWFNILGSCDDVDGTGQTMGECQHGRRNIDDPDSDSRG